MKITDKMRLDFIERKKDWTLDAEWNYLGMKKCWSIGEPERMSTWFPKLRLCIDAAIRAGERNHNEFIDAGKVLRTALTAAMVRLEEAEKKIANMVPRSRYDVACEQYTECEKQRMVLFNRCRELESKI